MSNYRVMDLFSGAGGLTFGFYYNLVEGKFVKRDDVEFVFANEYNPAAAAAFRENYPNINMIEGDIREELSDKVLDEYLKDGEVDVIIGGPPCQSFSTVGQRKYDERAKLSNEYLRVLKKVRPKMFLFENVKGILSMREIFYEEDENGNPVYEDVERHRGDKKFIRQDFVFYDSPERILNTLEAIKEVRGDIKVALGRELSKLFEEINIGKISEIQERYKDGIKGEIVCLVYRSEEPEKDSYRAKIAKLKSKGFKSKDISVILSELYDVSKNTIYEMVNAEK